MLDFAVPVDHRVKIKRKNEMKELKPCQKTKKQWNMMMTVTAIVIGVSS